MASTANATDLKALRLSQERPAATFSGYVMFALLLLGVAAAAAGFVMVVEEANRIVGLALFVAGAVAAAFIACGFYFLQPNQAAAILLFGDYRGTDRNAGLRWRWPWLTRTKISTRVHNVTSERLKVNDLRGNPIEIATNVVWRVTDTAQALFDVDDYNKFVFVDRKSVV